MRYGSTKCCASMAWQEFKHTPAQILAVAALELKYSVSCMIVRNRTVLFHDLPGVKSGR
jgi:hypothetical protein